MKFKPTVLLATLVITMGLLLGASAAQAATVNFDPNNSTHATGIENLDIGGTPYNVAFTATETVAEQIYGPFPGSFDFTNSAAANEAANAVNIELNQAGAQTVGAGGSAGLPFYRIGYDSETVGENIPVVIFWEAAKGDGDLDPWVTNIDPDGDSYNFGKRMWADFTLAGPTPDPVTIGGNVSGLEGSGLVLQNNGDDDEPIAADGEFTFDTPLTPGTFYNVTVATNPTNPSQTCSIVNGSGTVPTEDVTNVAVSCTEAVVGDLVKVAAEGDTLPDDTVLETILLDGGVAINIDGQVAFGGRDDGGNDAAFTQAGKVVAEGDTLDDGTILAAFRGQGEVGISDGQSGDRVAFHGQAETGLSDTAAVFTQAGKVAAVGDTLSAGITVDDIDPEGKVAINNFDQVAFHGSTEIEGGLFDEQFRVVFISDGVETRQAAREASNLPDGTPLDDITESGGVAINDFDEVAFHGQTVNPEPGGDSLKAVFTSDGLAAREGTDLLDGTILDDINEDGGVAINLFGDVAFHGQTVVPDTGGDSVKAVFISDGDTIQVVAKVGDILPDGNTLEDIEVTGGVAINLFGEVAFHGRTGGDRAVFTQNGLVAKEGDNLDDGTTLSEISDNAGVAINPYGFEVAFHGRIGTTDAVFVGEAPIIEPAAEGDE
jgi:hypothetical protein